ncbi:MAG: hypothetical protein AB8G99_21480 [Planctomycetaceae bacterium]
MLQLNRRKSKSQRVEPLEERTLLSTITITSLQDNLDTDGKVTLREALLAANEDRSVDGSEAGDGADTIVFASGFGGASIRLNGTQLRIASDVTIDGPADKITLDADDQSRIFAILDADEVNLIDLRLENGDAATGGAIRSRAAALSLTRTEFFGNSSSDGAGAVYVVDSPSGSLHVNDSSFMANHSDDGSAAIRTESSDDVAIETAIVNSTFQNNNGNSIVSSSLGPDDQSLVSDSEFSNNWGTAVIARTVRNSEFNNINGNGGGVREAYLVEGSTFDRMQGFGSPSAISLAPRQADGEESIIRDTVLTSSSPIRIESCEGPAKATE